MSSDRNAVVSLVILLPLFAYMVLGTEMILNGTYAHYGEFIAAEPLAMFLAVVISGMIWAVDSQSSRAEKEVRERYNK